MPTVITGTDGVSQVQAGAVESGDLPAGSVVKTAHHAFDDNTVTTSTSYVDVTGSSFSYTPALNNSSFFIWTSCQLEIFDTNRDAGLAFRIVVDGTAINPSTDTREIYFDGGNNNVTNLHTRSTKLTKVNNTSTNAVTIKLQIVNRDGSKVEFNKGGSHTSEILLMEIAG